MGAIDFNADLGESFGLWERGADDALMQRDLLGERRLRLPRRRSGRDARGGARRAARTASPSARTRASPTGSGSGGG